jgi:hypothetical protein
MAVWQRTGGMNEHKVLNALPPVLSREVREHRYGRLIASVKIFQMTEQALPNSLRVSVDCIKRDLTKVKLY